MLCGDTARGRHLCRLACIRSHVLSAYCNFESKQANPITLFDAQIIIHVQEVELKNAPYKNILSSCSDYIIDYPHVIIIQYVT